MALRGKQEWKWKERAIQTISEDLRRILGKNDIEGSTFVPVPPSKVRSDSAYDDRLQQILARMGSGFDADIRELVRQRESMAASHRADVRSTISELVENYVIDEELAATPPRNGSIVIFDDMLTTGRHFKAMQQILSARFPDATIFGTFVARNAPNTIDFIDLF